MYVNSLKTLIRLVLVFVIGTGLSYSASAKDDSYTQKQTAQINAEADLWLDTVFGYCLDRIAGQAEKGYPAELSGEWTAVREDAKVTLGLKLFNPFESPETRFTIVDVSPSGTSCWTQHSAPNAQIAAQKFDAVTKGDMSDRIKILKSGTSRTGAYIRYYEYYAEGSKKPIIIYQARNIRPQLSSFVTIVQRAEPDV